MGKQKNGWLEGHRREGRRERESKKILTRPLRIAPFGQYYFLVSFTHTHTHTHTMPQSTDDK
jgi:hypothetical protein